MKNTLLLLFTVMHLCGTAQTNDSFDDFRKRKKSMNLSTGINMKYVDEGNPKGEVLLLLHGYTDTGRSYKTTIDVLLKSRPDLRILAPDLRGHGQTSMPSASLCAADPAACFTPANFAADVIDLLDRNGITSAYVVGHSMGSIVAQEMALAYPQRVKKIVLIGTFANGKTLTIADQFLSPQFLTPWRTQLLASAPHFNWPTGAYLLTPKSLGEESCKAVRETWVTELSAQPEYLNEISRETIETPIGVWQGVISALTNYDNTQRLEQLTQSTLVLWPIQDMVVPEPYQALLREALEKAARKNKTIVAFKTYGKRGLPESGMQDSDLGHNLQWVAAEQVANDILSFIKTDKPIYNLPYLNEQLQLVVDKENSSVWTPVVK